MASAHKAVISFTPEDSKYYSNANTSEYLVHWQNIAHSYNSSLLEYRLSVMSDEHVKTMWCDKKGVKRSTLGLVIKLLVPHPHQCKVVSHTSYP
jgi:hypothetical protein